MNHIELLAHQYLSDPLSFWPCAASLLSNQRREGAPGTLQGVDCHFGIIRCLAQGRAWMQNVIAVGTMNDVDFMAALRQGISQAMQEDRVASKTVRRIKRRQVTKFKRSPHEPCPPLRIPR